MDFKTCTRLPLSLPQRSTTGQNARKKIRVALIFLFSVLFAAYTGECRSSESGINTNVADNGVNAAAQQKGKIDHSSKAPPLKPYPRLLQLQLTAPTLAQAGIPLDGISITLRNPGKQAPNSRLRLIIHNKDHDHHVLSYDAVKVEVLERGAWIPVLLGMAEGGVMGAIGSEGGNVHRERHQRGGFSIPAGMNKTWQLRVIFAEPGTYTLVAAVSPDNGSRHLAQPAHVIIEAQ